ncbi:MAG: hypothetical protein ACON5F_13105 [Jejuia sp.]
MKKLLLSCMLFTAFPSFILAQDIIELGNSESMCITVKVKGKMLLSIRFLMLLVLIL